MLRRWCLGMARLRRREEGSVAVEFGILVPLFLLLVFGIVDFGHAYYMKEMATNASREGARYGTRYVAPGGTRTLPKDLNPSIQNYLMNTWGGSGLNGLFSTANPQVTLNGPGIIESVAANLPDEDLTVTVTVTKNWFVIGKLIPGIGSATVISASTTMKCE
jgi:Flp pilus assembly protein TadG